tara:strand:+ start:553 stop:1485 length:933 start_codon:yes stop_codon:yes gene_type:complete
MIKLKNILLEDKDLIKKLVDAGIIDKSKAEEAEKLASDQPTDQPTDEKEVDVSQPPDEDMTPEERKVYLDATIQAMDKGFDDIAIETLEELLPDYTPPKFVGPKWFWGLPGKSETENWKGKQWSDWLNKNNKGKIGIDFKASGPVQMINFYPDAASADQSDKESQILSVLIDKGEMYINDFKIHVGNAKAYEILSQQFSLTPPRQDKNSNMRLQFGINGEQKIDNVKVLNDVLGNLVAPPDEIDPALVKKNFWDKFDDKLAGIRKSLKKKVPSLKLVDLVGVTKAEKERSAARKAKKAKKSKPTTGNVFN